MTTRRLAFVISVVLCFVLLVIVFLTGILNTITQNYFLLILPALLLFAISYFIVFKIVNLFILRNIKPLYKLLESEMQPNINYVNSKKKTDLIRDLQSNAPIWAMGKIKEIDQLRQLEKYRREFLGNVSHELKTPIFNIQGYILTLLDGGLKDKTINKKYLKKAEKSINRMITIVNDLESIARLESGELKLDLTIFNIVAVLEEVIEEEEIVAKDKKVQLKMKRKFDKGVFVEADKKKIHDVMINLVINSIKYGRRGGTSTIDLIILKNHVLIEISDDGIGISKTDLPRIFERFYRAENAREQSLHGSGLGLSIVKHILEAHNQTVTVQSKIGVGTTFAFTLKKSDE